MVQFRIGSRIPADGRRRGEFLEYAQVFGKNWYGTPRKWLDEALAQKKDLVLEIDVQGALQVKQKLPDAVAIFVLPPSREDLEQRIRERGQDSEDEIRRRLERARQEMLNYQQLRFRRHQRRSRTRGPGSAGDRARLALPRGQTRRTDSRNFEVLWRLTFS